MSEWQPIETAPKDGTYLHLKGNGFRSDIVREIIGNWTSEYTEGWEDEKGNWFYPTHWMPIPEPPKP